MSAARQASGMISSPRPSGVGSPPGRSIAPPRDRNISTVATSVPAAAGDGRPLNPEWSSSPSALNRARRRIAISENAAAAMKWIRGCASPSCSSRTLATIAGATPNVRASASESSWAPRSLKVFVIRATFPSTMSKMPAATISQHAVSR